MQRNHVNLFQAEQSHGVLNCEQSSHIFGDISLAQSQKKQKIYAFEKKKYIVTRMYISDE